MPVATRTDEQIRRDLIGALATCVAEKGYAATTIADIVAGAHVSKRTFYEHFSNKEECLMALYESVCDKLMRIIRASGTADQPWQVRIREGAASFLSALDSMPAFSRTVLIEVQAAGPRAFQLRQETLRRFARTIADLVELGRGANPSLRPMTLEQALTIVGGLNELLLHAANPYAGPPSTRPFSALQPEVVRLIAAVLTYRDDPR